ncbi:MAG: hypothetical protein MPJ24_06650 [Pirellulaceae bacterium]|nr:hypothetical protein [Pirellulaceae bacterium]
MSSHWALKVALEDAPVLGRLRHTREITVCEEEDYIWAQGTSLNTPLDEMLRTIPGFRFNVLEDNQLVQHDRSVPLGYLPSKPWVPIASWLRVKLPFASPAGNLRCSVQISLVRSEVLYEPDVLIANYNDWYKYSVNASSLRLDCLQFAMNGGAMVVIQGSPLPPIIGKHYVNQCRIVVPAGWTWAPALDASVLHRLFRLESNDVALLHHDGSYDLIEGEQFVQASRTAVRASMGVIPHEH